MSLWQVLFLLALGCGAGLVWALPRPYEDDTPNPLDHLRQEMLAVQTLLQILRTSSTARDAMLAEAGRQRPVGR